MYTREGFVSKEYIIKHGLSQAQIILLHLLKNNFITNATAHNAYGIRHLPARIRDLKNVYGCKFKNISQKDFLNRYKQKTDFDEYHLINIKELKALLYN